MNNFNERSSSSSMCAQSDSGLILTTDPKPRLRWTLELHDRFVDAVAQLGGPDIVSSSLEAHRDTTFSSGFMNRNINENNVHIGDAIQMQMEVQRRLQEQLEVQRHLQLRIEAQGKYMQNIIEKACQTLAGETNSAASASYKGNNILPGNSPHMNFPCLQDLNIYGGDQVDLHRSMDANRPSFENFMKAPSDNLCLGQKWPNPYIGGNGKSPLIWFDDLGLQELGPSAN
uniref:MYB-CC type transcription factor LHEQLE-containing domain-containing protein n=1 Tax=Chenopodium quinoa TaxID=63459 RepID=A0A803N6Y1_CHEQI